MLETKKELTFYLETYGCTLNSSDSEIIAAIMVRMDFVRVQEVDGASFIIVNTCGVKIQTEQKILHRLSVIGKLEHKHVIIAGCLPEIFKHDLTRLSRVIPTFSAIVGPRNYHELERVVSDILKGGKNIISMSGDSLEPKFKLEQLPSHEHVGIVPIAEGCTGACTYCCTRFARGRIRSYPANTLEAKIKKFQAASIKEFWVTAEDCSAYEDGRAGLRLPGLLDSLTGLDGDFFIRVGMMNPKTLLPIHQDLIKSFSSRKIFKFIHVPIQSGSNRVLREMNRQYTVGEFMKIVDAFKQRFPAITISTDIICGYPGETGDDFDESIDLIKRLNPDIINISMYGHRPGTPASKLRQLPSSVVKSRSRQLTALHDKIKREKGADWIGWEGIAVIDEYNPKKGNYIARNSYYKPIVVENAVLGSIARVKITRSAGHYFFGKIMTG
ncbi:MAG: tRNA (N(6)-L-threonylcarbamoyladenosine(37)-C(2))-methylthiotransferase [Promethearchaeota archaeon]